MAYDKERAIAAQNAATAAATLLQGTGAGLDEFERVRQAITAGTISIAEQGLQHGSVPVSTAAAVQSVQSEFPGATVVEDVPPTVVSSSDAGTVEIRNGKHAGKTIAQVYATEPSWLTWASENLRNDFLRNKVQEYLRSVPAAA